MSDIKIEKLDTVFIRVLCDRSIAKELSDFFTFKVPGHQYMPAFRRKVWDGEIRLYNIYKQTIYVGLLKYVIQFAKDRNYSYECFQEPARKFYSENDVEKYIDDFLKPSANGERIYSHEHQIMATAHAINKNRCLLLSPTGSGKSLIIYALTRYYFDLIPQDKKILIVVPTTGLVSQMMNDFRDYSSNSPWDADQNTHFIYAGKDKNTPKKIVITTWQSIYNMPESWFRQFDVVIGDEAHLYKAKSLTSIMEKLKQCPYRIGTTGTLDGTLTNKFVLEGLFGPVYSVISTKDLMDQDLLTLLNIENVILQYDEEYRKNMVGQKYMDEMDWIVQHQPRNEFIRDLTLKLTGNTLVLFQYVEKHGKNLHKMLDDVNVDKNRPIFFVYGGTDVEVREEIRQITEKEKSAIIVASYQTFSTGISIRNLHNIVFASPSKSRIRVLQSIGRQLRKSKDKSIAKLYDISDDLCWKSKKNHTYRHYEERMKIYESEKFVTKTFKVPLKRSDV
jgi:superfamily II DNA or RNA helicase